MYACVYVQILTMLLIGKILVAQLLYNKGIRVYVQILIVLLIGYCI